MLIPAWPPFPSRGRCAPPALASPATPLRTCGGGDKPLRNLWEVMQNRYLEAAGRQERVDLRSFERQNNPHVPQVHLGPSASAMERRGIQTNLGNLNRYKDHAETIIGNCSCVLFLGGKERSALKEISETLGKETIDLYNTSDTRGSQRSIHDTLLVVCVPASGSNRNFVFFVTQKRRKRREILFGIFYACEPFKI